MSINRIIRQKYSRFSAKQKQIADYLMENEDGISFKTLKEISAEAGVTEVTVINFCKALGFVNFTALKECYRREMLINLSPVKKIFEDTFQGEAHSDFFKNIVAEQLRNHQSAMCKLREDHLDIAVGHITGARKVYIFCEGLSLIIGQYLKLKLENSAISVELVDINRINTLFFMKSLDFTKDDLYICITFPIYSKVVLRLSEHFQSSGYNVVSITDKPSSPLAKYSNVTFYGDNSSISFYNSIQAAISVVEVLAAVIHQKRKSLLMCVKKDVEAMEKEFYDLLN